MSGVMREAYAAKTARARNVRVSRARGIFRRMPIDTDPAHVRRLRGDGISLTHYDRYDAHMRRLAAHPNHGRSRAEAWLLEQIALVADVQLLDAWLQERMTWVQLWRIATRYPFDHGRQRESGRKYLRTKRVTLAA